MHAASHPVRAHGAPLLEIYVVSHGALRSTTEHSTARPARIPRVGDVVAAAWRSEIWTILSTHDAISADIWDMCPLAWNLGCPDTRQSPRTTAESRADLQYAFPRLR